MQRLRDFVQAMTRLVSEADGDEARILAEGRGLLESLVARDDWLPGPFAEPHPEHYQQYLLHCDPLERFSVVSFVWGPGQRTPIHDHTVWGLVGLLRGAERCRSYDVARGREPVAEAVLRPGTVIAVSPAIGDVHEVANAAPGVSVSIHVYGANIGAVRRHVFDPRTLAPKDFVSGYASTMVPNIWDRSAEIRSRL